MKLAVVAVLLCLTSTALGGSRSATDAESRGLRGTVRVVREFASDLRIVDGVTVEGPRLQLATETYDARGQLLTSVRYTDGVPTERRAYTPHGMNVTAVQSDYRRANTHFALVSTGPSAGQRDTATWRTELSVVTHQRNEHGQIVGSCYHEGDEHSPVLVHESFHYDGSGRLVETVRMLSDGTVLGRDVAEYDAAGALAVLTVFNETGVVVQQTSYDGYAFDGKGNWTRRMEHVSSGSAVASERVVYRTIQYQPPRSRRIGRSGSIARARSQHGGCWSARFAYAANQAGSTTRSAEPKDTVARSLWGVADATLAVGNQEKSDAEPPAIGRRSRRAVDVEIVVRTVDNTTEDVETVTTTDDADADSHR